MPKLAKPKSPYEKGPLTEPIYLQPGTLLTGFKSPSEMAMMGLTEHMKKIDDLFEHFGIDQSDNENKWVLLSFALAREHVEGFKIIYGSPPKKGRSQKWLNTGEGIELYLSVMKILWANPETSKLKAIEQVAKQMKIDPKGLRTRFEEVSRKHAMIIVMKHLSEKVGISEQEAWLTNPHVDELIESMRSTTKKK